MRGRFPRGGKSRAAYQHILERVLGEKFPELTLAQMSNAVDLERPLGPIYSRGLLKRGQSDLRCGSEEPQGSIDAALTFEILWLEVCGRRRASGPTWARRGSGLPDS